MFSRLKKKIFAKAMIKLSHLFEEVKKNKISKICSFPNVKIHSTFKLEEGTEFFISEPIKELSIFENVAFRRFCTILLYSNAILKIHKNVFFNNNCSINCLGEISIGENTIFGESVKIYDHNHIYSKSFPIEILTNSFTIGKIEIGKNCWIGSNVTILNNVTIGDNVIIGANCLIYKSIDSNCIVKSNQSLTITPIT